MIVDVHTHIFPPRMIAARAELAAADAGFTELYGDPHARMATAFDLLASMDAAGIDVSVASGFWWQSAVHAAEHRAYIFEVAAASNGRILPFVPLAPDEPIQAAAGATGLGEVRVTAAGPWTAKAAANGLPLLVHCSEEVGHAYAGKAGGLRPGALWGLVSAHAGIRVIAAHWGGGFPFYALMPEVRAVLGSGRLVFDTAASSLLYDPRVFEVATNLVGEGLVLWGSDFPLRAQADDRARTEAAIRDLGLRAAIMGDNAARLLHL